MNKLSKLYLIGFMGAGKSTVGKLLSQRLDYQFIDLDKHIEETSKTKITQIFSEQGEDHFRELESGCLKNISNNKSHIVVSTGGGAVLKAENLNIMRTSGTMIYLKAGIDTIWQRIKDEKGRPLLEVEDPYETAKNIFESRRSIYESADIVIDTGDFTPDEVSEKIFGLLFI